MFQFLSFASLPSLCALLRMHDIERKLKKYYILIIKHRCFHDKSVEQNAFAEDESRLAQCRA